MDKNHSQLVESYNTSTIFSLIRKGEAPDSFKNERGFTILGRSIVEQDYQVLCFLLEKGASPNKIKLINGYFDPLNESIKRKQFNAALKIIEYSKNLEQEENKEHPAYLAIDKKIFNVFNAMIPKLPLSFINSKNTPLLHYLIKNMVVERDQIGNVKTSIKFVSANKYVFLSPDSLFNLLDKNADVNMLYENKNAAEMASFYWEKVLTGNNVSSAAIAAYALLQQKALSETGFYKERMNNSTGKEKVIHSHIL